MASWQSFLINPFLRYRVKRVLASTSDPLVARRILGAPMPPPKGAVYAAGELGGVGGEWTRPASGKAAARLLFLHGGGYFACSPQSHRSITAAYAIRGYEVFSPQYRLAPEHPFPAAVEDALAAYRAMPTPFVIGGDSAGGGLALAAMFAARAAGLALPAAALLFSPWTDLACTGPSLVTNARRDPMMYGPRMREGAEIYLAGADPLNPLASPLYGDFTGLPPLLIQVGTDEVLLDDSRRVADRARAAGVTVDYSEWPDMPHVWQVSQVILPESRKALDLAAAFGLRALASAAHPA